MKKLLILLFLLPAPLFAQKKNENLPPKKLDPTRGHYRGLEAFNPKPGASSAEIDRQKFPYDAAQAEKRLSLKPYYLENVTVNDFDLPNPPANSSEQTRAELNYLLNLQNQRTENDVRTSLYMAQIFYSPRIQPADSLFRAYRQNLFFIGRSIGTWFNQDDLPVTAELIAHVWRDASYFIWSLKYKYLRVRPYVLEPALKNLEETNWAAYPSGHAANSYINAYLYQELAPAFSDIFLKDAYDMAHSREILGVHYPTDSEVSRIFARQFVNKLFRNEKFLQDFENAKKEWQEKARENFDRPATLNTDDHIQGPSCAKKCQ
jgi:acid phosphatase (class A)